MTQIHNLVSLHNFVYMIEEEVPKGNLYVRPKSPCGTILGSLVEAVPTGMQGLYGSMMHDVKTVASNNPSLGLPLLPAIEKDIKKLAEIEYPFGSDSSNTVMTHRYGFIKGYKASKAKKYSEEDMKRVYNAGAAAQRYMLTKVKGMDVTLETFDEIIKSLNPLPKKVEVEVTLLVTDGTYNGKMTNEYVPMYFPKIVNNIVQVKRWIYE